MKVYSKLGAAVLIVCAALMVAPAQAQLLGGLLGGGDGSGDGGLVGGLLGDGGLLGGDGGLVGNGGLVDLNTSGDSTVGVTGVATVTFGNGTSNGGVTVLGGGGGNDLDLPLGLLGGNGTGVDLPGLGGLLGGPGTPGQPGAPGAPGRPGVNGSAGGGNGSNGINGFNGRNGGPGGAFTFNTNSSKLKLLAAILQNRAWLRFAAGSGICLPGYGVADVTSWVPQKDWNQMQQIVATYSQDIYTLRTMLAKCRGGSKVGNSVANRAIGIDIQNGMPVVFVL